MSRETTVYTQDVTGNWISYTVYVRRIKKPWSLFRPVVIHWDLYMQPDSTVSLFSLPWSLIFSCTCHFESCHRVSAVWSKTPELRLWISYILVGDEGPVTVFSWEVLSILEFMHRLVPHPVLALQETQGSRSISRFYDGGKPVPLSLYSCCSSGCIIWVHVSICL